MPEIVLPWPAKPLFPNFRSSNHWAKTKAAKTARATAFWLTKEAKAGVAAGDVPIRLRIRFDPPGRYGYDRDNLAASLKPYLDGIADALGVNDNLFRPGEPEIGEPFKGGRVLVEILP